MNAPDERSDLAPGAPPPSKARERLGLGIILTLAAIGTFVGWRELYFLCDDAFIAFRYASNSLDGLGLVWNPPPFQPVEGYTGFLWVFLLRQIWAITGVEPPAVAGALSLAFGYATLALGVHMMLRMKLPPRMVRIRLPLLALVLLGTIANRTFLTWLSSGLETAMFNFAITWWVHAGTTRPEGRGDGWAWRLTISSTVAALTRPGGILCVAGSLLILAHEQVRKGSLPRLRRLLAVAPIAIIGVHLLWRHSFYGEWLPNTYFAKHVSPWPESGLRYLASFTIENGFWVWPLLALLVLLFARRRPGIRGVLGPHFAPLLVLGVLAGHAGYYTLIVGGDHFEYRVYSELVLLGFLSAAWMVAHTRWHPAAALGALAFFVIASLPVQWVHYRATRDIDQRTVRLVVPIAQEFPEGLRAPIERFDRHQRWLINHYVGMRRKEHELFWRQSVELLPSREEGARRFPADERHIIATGTVGVLGWVFPHVAIVDILGLNDYVIARNPIPPDRTRHMAHDRRAPRGYVDCFRPDLQYDRPRGRVRTKRGRRPVPDVTVVHCEHRFRRLIAQRTTWAPEDYRRPRSRRGLRLPDARERPRYRIPSPRRPRAPDPEPDLEPEPEPDGEPRPEH